MKYANADATDGMVYEACRAARIHDKIMSFPDQYNTKVGERGLRLSGGEKQRVAIARTILKNPRVILLDEATAALDSETEQHIQKALKELSEGRTTLVIAHRLSTITSANQILCIHQGRVVERGTHEELLALNGRYSMMWAKQVKAEARARESTDIDGSSSDGQRSPVSSDGGEEIGVLSRPETAATVGQAMAVPRSQDEVVGVEVMPVSRKNTVTLQGAGAVERTCDIDEGRRASRLERRPSVRRSASGTSLSTVGNGVREVRWDTSGLREALGKK